MKKLLLVDGHSLIHRAYHAYPRTLATKSGELTNAVYGFTNILLSAINEIQPTHTAVAFDLPVPTFRETMFVGYKQSRVKPDDDLIAQIPRIKEVVGALNIPIFEVAGYEADDVIGTLAKQARELLVIGYWSRQGAKGKGKTQTPLSQRPNQQLFESEDSQSRRLTTNNRQPAVQVVILTSDRDLMQLIVDDIVVVKMPERGKKVNRLTGQQVKNQTKPSSLITFSREAGSGSAGQPANLSDIWNEARFIQEWGFAPTFLPDYKAFAGDQSDDIPGVGGIGEKTARLLIETFGGVDQVYEKLRISPTPSQISNLKSQIHNVNLKAQEKNSTLKITETLIRKLAEDQESAQLSKKLATIDTSVPIQLDWKAMEVHEYEKEKVLKLFDELQFKSLIRKLPNDIFEQAVQEVLF